MAGKFLQIWPLRSVAKATAVLVIIALAVAIYATREIPDTFKDSEEWKFWRNLDFAVCVVSLAFASALLYGSITEFRLFVLAWMVWNVLLTVFWIILLVRKYNELVQWEKTFRLVAIVFMVLAEIPVFNYFRFLGATIISDPEADFSWMATPSDKVYKTLSERPSLTSAVNNLGFRQDSGRNSVVSVASEETEQNDIAKEKVENKEENVEKHKEESSDTESQKSIEISVTIHSEKPTEGNETDANEFIEIPNNETTENVLTTSEEPLPTIETAQESSSSSTELKEDEQRKETVTESDEVNSEVATNEASNSMDITEDTEANEIVESSPQATSSVVVEIEKEDSPTKSSHVDSSVMVTVEIDVTDTVHEDANQTSF